MIVKEFEVLLRVGDVKKSIERMRNWLADATPGDPEKLILACVPELQPHLRLLMRDLLSRYPSTLLGCPMMLYVTPDEDAAYPPPERCTLPYPSLELAKPCEELHFIGYLPVDAQLPVPLPFKPGSYSNSISWRTPTAVVALFRSHPGVLDYEALSISPMWWGEVLHGSGANVIVDAKLLMPYPDALDIARGYQAGARGDKLPVSGSFVDDLSLPRDLGVLFMEHYQLEYPI